TPPPAPRPGGQRHASSQPQHPHRSPAQARAPAHNTAPATSRSKPGVARPPAARPTGSPITYSRRVSHSPPGVVSWRWLLADYAHGDAFSDALPHALVGRRRDAARTWVLLVILQHPAAPGRRYRHTILIRAVE